MPLYIVCSIHEYRLSILRVWREKLSMFDDTINDTKNLIRANFANIFLSRS